MMRASGVEMAGARAEFGGAPVYAGGDTKDRTTAKPKLEKFPADFYDGKKELSPEEYMKHFKVMPLEDRYKAILNKFHILHNETALKKYSHVHEMTDEDFDILNKHKDLLIRHLTENERVKFGGDDDEAEEDDEDDEVDEEDDDDGNLEKVLAAYAKILPFIQAVEELAVLESVMIEFEGDKDVTDFHPSAVGVCGPRGPAAPPLHCCANDALPSLQPPAQVAPLAASLTCGAASCDHCSGGPPVVLHRDCARRPIELQARGASTSARARGASATRSRPPPPAAPRRRRRKRGLVSALRARVARRVRRSRPAP